MMFKIMVLQALYGLSDDQAEFQVQDRLSFMRFLGLGLGDRVPDAKTICKHPAWAAAWGPAVMRWLCGVDFR